MGDDLKEITCTCQVCRQPFRCAKVYPDTDSMKLRFDGKDRVICGDCRVSLRQWLRARLEVGLEQLEKRKNIF